MRRSRSWTARWKFTQRTAPGEQGRLSLGMTPTASFHPLVPRTVCEFRDCYPRVLVTLEEALTNSLLERLHDERMDAAFIRNTLMDPTRLTITPLLDEIMVAALPSGHALARCGDDAERSPCFGGEALSRCPLGRR